MPFVPVTDSDRVSSGSVVSPSHACPPNTTQVSNRPDGPRRARVWKYRSGISWRSMPPRCRNDANGAYSKREPFEVSKPTTESTEYDSTKSPRAFTVCTRYQEAHTVSQLKGSPPGYVGYGQGGVLTEAVRRRPYSVILLDEVEKAHRDVLNVFYQVFDRGFMRDGEGRVIDFRNTVIVTTSNLGSEQIMVAQEAVVEAGGEVTTGMLMEAIRPTLIEHFQPALLARFQTVVYRPLSSDAMTTIVRMKLAKVAQRIERKFNVPLICDDALIGELVCACQLPDSGARNIDSLLDQQILPVLSRELLMRVAQAQTLHAVRLSYSDETGIAVDFDEAPSDVHVVSISEEVTP
jgi:hypothetical protein